MSKKMELKEGNEEQRERKRRDKFQVKSNRSERE